MNLPIAYIVKLNCLNVFITLNLRIKTLIMMLLFSFSVFHFSEKSFIDFENSNILNVRGFGVLGLSGYFFKENKR